MIFVTPRLIHQPTNAEIKLQQWLQMEEAMRQDLDPKDRRAELVEQGLLPPSQEGPAVRKRKGKRR